MRGYKEERRYFNKVLSCRWIICITDQSPSRRPQRTTTDSIGPAHFNSLTKYAPLERYNKTSSIQGCHRLVIKSCAFDAKAMLPMFDQSWALISTPHSGEAAQFALPFASRDYYSLGSYANTIAETRPFKA